MLDELLEETAGGSEDSVEEAVAEILGDDTGSSDSTVDSLLTDTIAGE